MIIEKSPALPRFDYIFFQNVNDKLTEIFIKMHYYHPEKQTRS